MGSVSDSFRQLVDAISAGLQSHVERPHLSANALGISNEELAEMQLCVSRVTDLARAHRWTSGAARKVTVEDLRHILGTISDFRRPWRSYVRGTVTGPTLAALEALICDSNPDILTLLGQHDRENAHSDVLRWLLDPRQAPHVAPGTLVELLRVSGGEKESQGWQARLSEAIEHNTISVMREYQIGSTRPHSERRRIDILISGPDFDVAIENKLWSTEHDTQTVAYWDWLSSAVVGRQHRSRERYFAGLMLSPTGLLPHSPHFRPVSYLQLMQALLASAPLGGRGGEAQLTDDERCMLGGYLRTLREHVLRVEFNVLLSPAEGPWAT